jgi:hypothetical protein
VWHENLIKFGRPDGLRRQSATGVIKSVLVGAAFCLTAYLLPFAANLLRTAKSFTRQSRGRKCRG